MRKTIQAKHIPEELVLDLLHLEQPAVVEFPDVPPKVLRAKLRVLVRRGLIARRGGGWVRRPSAEAIERIYTLPNGTFITGARRAHLPALAT